jgi:alpha-1,2-glucosyltransferase
LFPILLPFFPLIYTDILSLSLVLFALLAALQSRRFLLCLFFLLAALVRQNNILWAPLLFAILLESDPLWRLSAPDPVTWLRKAAQRLRDGRALRSLFRSAAPLLLPIIAFVVFVIVTGRASFNPDLDSAHPFPSFSLGNIFFTLFLFTALFLPLVLVRARTVVLLLRRPWILLLLVALFLLFSFGFHVDHPANSEVARLRDTILLAAAAGGTTGFLFWLLGALGVLTMLATPLARRSFAWIYPLSLLYLGGSWLIETRYAIMPLVLFLLLRKPNSWRIEILQYVFNCVLLLWVFF